MPTSLPLRTYARPRKQANIRIWIVAPIALALFSIGVSIWVLYRADPDSAMYQALAINP